MKETGCTRPKQRSQMLSVGFVCDGRYANTLETGGTFGDVLGTLEGRLEGFQGANGGEQPVSGVCIVRHENRPHSCFMGTKGQVTFLAGGSAVNRRAEGSSPSSGAIVFPWFSRLKGAPTPTHSTGLGTFWGLLVRPNGQNLLTRGC